LWSKHFLSWFFVGFVLRSCVRDRSGCEILSFSDISKIQGYKPLRTSCLLVSDKNLSFTLRHNVFRVLSHLEHKGFFMFWQNFSTHKHKWKQNLLGLYHHVWFLYVNYFPSLLSILNLYDIKKDAAVCSFLLL
jgi:hypothetical protein